jgi:hypothetical protein
MTRKDNRMKCPLNGNPSKFQGLECLTSWSLELAGLEHGLYYELELFFRSLSDSNVSKRISPSDEGEES